MIENFKEIKVERNFDDQRFKMKKRPPFDKEVEISYPVTVESICSGKKKKVMKSTNVLKSGKDEPQRLFRIKFKDSSPKFSSISRIITKPPIHTRKESKPKYHKTSDLI